MKWPTYRLDQCTEIVSGSTPKTDIEKYWDGEINWATPKDLSDLNQKIISDTPDKITQEGYDSCSTQLLPVGSVLFSSRAPIGHVAINGVPMCTNQGFKSFIPKKELLDASYLYYWLIFKRDYLQSLGNGATFKEVSKATIARVEIPLPPLEEQRRIAAILDKAEALRAKRREAIAKLDQLLQSVFLEMFGDSVTNNKKWNEGKLLGEVADICSGITKGRKTTSETKSIPYLAVSNVQDRFLKLDVVKEIDATEDEIEKYKLKKNDLLLTEGGDPDKLGRGSLWHEEIPLCIHQNHVFRVRLNNKEINPIYLNWLVGSPRGKRYFLSVAKQTTGIASINLGQLKRFPLLIPPLELQEKFAKIEQAVREKHMVEQKASLEKIDALIGSIQASYFQ